MAKEYTAQEETKGEERLLAGEFELDGDVQRKRRGEG